MLPKQPGVCRKYLRSAQLNQDMPSSDALFIPSADKAMGKSAFPVYYDSPVVTASACAVVDSLGLTMQFYGTVSQAPVVLSMDSQCSHTLMSASYAQRMKLHVEQSGEAPFQVAVANGQVCTAIGICKVRLKLQEFSGDLTCHVLSLLMHMKPSWARTGSASVLLLCRGVTRFVYLPGAVTGSHWFLGMLMLHLMCDHLQTHMPLLLLLRLTRPEGHLQMAVMHFWQCALMYRLPLLRLVLL